MGRIIDVDTLLSYIKDPKNKVCIDEKSLANFEKAIDFFATEFDKKLLEEIDNILYDHCSSSDYRMAYKRISNLLFDNKDKKYCKDFGMYYGDYSTMYDGILVDINELPIGTEFRLRNGGWSGKIMYDEESECKFINCGNHSMWLSSEYPGVVEITYMPEKQTVDGEIDDELDR